ncbi:MAG: ribbon-helix-helix protein, CopG family [Desulfurococcaceae archaeon]
MPRPREIGPGEIISTKLSIEDARRLRELARREGMSVSQLLRKIILQYLSQKTELPTPLSDDPSPQLDPLTAVELEDFKEALSSFEKKVKELELAVKPLTEGRTIGPVGQRRTLTSSEMQLINRIKNLRSEWLRYKRWYKSIGHRDSELTTRLANIYNIIRTLEKSFVKP